MRTLKLALIALAMLALPAVVRAQAITQYNFRVYNQGASSPIQAPTVLQVANIVCNQSITAGTGTVANPSTLVWNDPVNAGKQCSWTDPGTGVLFSLPFGAQVYESTLTAQAGTLTSPESARSNLFTHPGVAPSAPTGLSVKP